MSNTNTPRPVLDPIGYLGSATAHRAKGTLD